MITFLRDLFFKDFWLKLFSFGLALLIWVTVSFATRHSGSSAGNPLATQQMTFFSVPVAVVSAASDVHDFQVDPKAVTVTVQGERKILEKIETRDIRAMIDLTGIEAKGDIRKRIEVSTPSGVTHVRVDPEDVKVIFPHAPASTKND